MLKLNNMTAQQNLGRFFLEPQPHNGAPFWALARMIITLLAGAFGLVGLILERLYQKSQGEYTLFSPLRD